MGYILWEGAVKTQRLLIQGGRRLSGAIPISGSKNAVLPMLAAAVAFRQPVRIQNCPDLTDVDAALDILSYLGAQWTRHGKTIEIDPRWVEKWEIPQWLMCRMRGSVLFAGPLMARFGVCELMQPGGCPLGSRPVDFHRQGLLALGAQEDTQDTRILCGPLKGGEVSLPFPSVGATENLVMAAVGAWEDTVIRNAAREPEIVCLCDFLRAGGCDISGDGTGTICVRGRMPETASHPVIPDRMEAATFACAAASAGGQVELRDTCWRHLAPVLDVLEHSGCRIQRRDDAIYVEADGLHTPGRIETGPYPGFPTDAQAVTMAALLRARGNTTIKDDIFSDRMQHIPGLRALGADIRCRGSEARIRGVERLHGEPVAATDLRGGAALAVAALAAEGETEITAVHHLMRGYEDFAGKLRSVGARVEMA